MIISGSSDGSVRVWNIFKNQLMKSYHMHASDITSVVIDRNKNVISASMDHTIKSLNIVKGEVKGR